MGDVLSSPILMYIQERIIFVRKISFVIFIMTCVFLVSSLSFAQTNNSDAYFLIDTTLSQAGYQENSPQMNIGPNEKVGFAVYAGNVDRLKSFNIDIQWDSSLAICAGYDANIGEDDITINGQAISLARETNIFGEASANSAKQDDTGHFSVDYVHKGDEPVVDPSEGLLYYFELETASDFSDIKKLDVSVVVTLDSGEVEPPITLTKNVFLVNTIETNVKTYSWKEIKKKFKDF